jgi:eukaryotic-like serine/threonine-protein kinase
VKLAAGAKLGPYEILSPIGEGGMGEVWKARDTRLDRVVAIKRLKGEYSDRFQHEARTIAALNHPHICQIYDVGSDYLVLEFVEGKHLEGPVPVETAVQVALQIASALEAAHRKGVLHRDLKPANVMVTSAGIKLLDFGISKLISGDDAATQISEVSGTPLYMSPEQAEGKRLDERSDVFSFGAVLYELLTGRRAFDSLAAVLRDEPGALNAPAWLRSIVMRCLRKNAQERFATFSEVRAALDQVVQAQENEPSIAVLPFVNMSGDKEQEYFSDGLAEEIINALVQSPGLKVTARTSAFSFKGKDAKIAQIAQELGVEHVLEGSVRKAGNRIRVTAQLIKASDGFHLWSERYDRELSDIFAVQDEVSSAITAALRTKLSGQAGSRKQYTPNVGAYEEYLKGLHYILKADRSNHEICRKSLERAIELDPRFASPHVALAMYYHIASSSFMPPREAIPLGRAHARKALDLDSSLPEANAWLGIFAVVYDLNWEEGRRRFQLATAHQPIQPMIRHLYAYFFLRPLGRGAEAVDEHRKALDHDPLNLIIRVGLATSLREAGRNQEAAAEARKILEFDSNYFPTYNLQAFDYTWGPPEEALALAERGHQLSPYFSPAVGSFAGLLTRAGQHERAKQVLQELDDTERSGRCCAFTIYHLLCGNLEQAVEWTEKAIEQQEQMVTMLLLPTPWGPMLRRSPRWPVLARKLNLPAGEFWDELW